MGAFPRCKETPPELLVRRREAQGEKGGGPAPAGSCENLNIPREEQRLAGTVADLNSRVATLKGYLVRNNAVGLDPGVFALLAAPVFEMTEDAYWTTESLLRMAEQGEAQQGRRCAFHAMLEHLDHKVRVLLRLEAAVAAGDRPFIGELVEHLAREG